MYKIKLALSIFLLSHFSATYPMDEENQNQDRFIITNSHLQMIEKIEEKGLEKCLPILEALSSKRFGRALAGCSWSTCSLFCAALTAWATAEAGRYVFNGDDIDKDLLLKFLAVLGGTCTASCTMGCVLNSILGCLHGAGYEINLDDSDSSGDFF